MWLKVVMRTKKGNTDSWRGAYLELRDNQEPSAPTVREQSECSVEKSSTRGDLRSEGQARERDMFEEHLFR